ncbi:MAG: hypothetical protein WD077_14080 [Bacteroidia bacterium]
MKYILAIGFLIVLAQPSLRGQDANLPHNTLSYQYLDRLEIKSGKLNDSMYLDLREVPRQAAAAFLRKLDSSSLGAKDSFQLQYLHNELLFEFPQLPKESKRPVLNTFYRDPANFFQINIPEFQLTINPVAYFHYGMPVTESPTATDDEGPIYQNTRGLELRGSVDRKVGFYAMVQENQAGLPDYVDRFVRDHRAIPGAGFYKGFGTDRTGYDYFVARGYITASPTRHIRVQFGHDRNFIGNGYRSLLMSDFSDDYLFLKINTNVWKLNYQNLFTEMTDRIGSVDEPYNKKYGAFHYLSLNISDKLNVGLFEGIIFHDRLGTGRGYDLNYLNPVIFYRSVEHDLGSPDNAMVGLNFNIFPIGNVAVYGQLVFDEFLLDNFMNRGDSSQWWGNKHGLQVGLKYVDALTIPNLDYQVEFNTVRPFTYSGITSATSYTHFNQPLAHPLGASFREVVNILIYRPWPFLQFRMQHVWATYGEDLDGRNYGGNILRGNQDHTGEFGYKIAGGDTRKLHLVNFTTTWQPRHNLFLDLNILFREESGETSSFTEPVFTTLSMRLNIPERRFDW